MNIALIIFGALLAFAAIGSAVSKFKKVPDVMTAMASVGVKPHQVPLLGALEVAGGLGIVLGIWIKPLGIVTAIALALYFVGAFASHMRKGHKVKDFGASLGILVIALVTTILELKR